MTEVGCLAHARRKFHELWANHGSQVGQQALKFFGQLYDVEREISDSQTEQRKEVRRRRSRPVADALHQWLVQQAFQFIVVTQRHSHLVRRKRHCFKSSATLLAEDATRLLWDQVGMED